MPAADEPRAPLIGVCRHRLATDGRGVTTLVAFHGCPLRCRYCLNAQCLAPDGVQRTVGVNELLNEVAVDNLYFLATGGGVTFGGGEPLLRSTFIDAFARAMPAAWHLTVETSLNVDRHHLERVLPHVGHFIVDIKDPDPDRYRAYTTRPLMPAFDNLCWLLARSGDMAERVTVRLPHIKGYNTAEQVADSRLRLEALGVAHIDEFHYTLPADAAV